MSTSHNLRRAVRLRMTETGENWTTARRAITGEIVKTRPGVLDAATPPADWRDVQKCPAIAALKRDRDGDGAVDELVLFDRKTGERLAEITYPHVPADELLMKYEAKIADLVSGCPAQLELLHKAELGHPEKMVDRLGYEAYIGSRRWQQWSDGSWRIAAEPTNYTHSVTRTKTTTSDGTPADRLVVVEHPESMVLDAVVPEDAGDRERLHRVLDEHGFVTDHLWEELWPGTYYRRARRGNLAQRHWGTTAKVRVLRDVKAGSAEGEPRLFRKGEIVTMMQWGRAGHEVKRDAWWTSTDVEYGKMLAATDVEVVEVIEDYPPTWAEAKLDADAVTKLLNGHAGTARHIGGAKKVAQAWADAGLYVALERAGLVVHSPAPEYRRLGRVQRDKDGRLGRPYEAIVKSHEFYEDAAFVGNDLPLDPVAAVEEGKRRVAEEQARRARIADEYSRSKH